MASDAKCLSNWYSGLLEVLLASSGSGSGSGSGSRGLLAKWYRCLGIPACATALDTATSSLSVSLSWLGCRAAAAPLQRGEAYRPRSAILH